MDSRESATARWTAYVGLAAILAVQAVYALYWNDALPLTTPELRPGAAVRDSVMSIFLLAATTLIAFFLGQRVMRDTWCSTALALAYVLFPPVIATYALQTPHGSIAVYLSLVGAFAGLAAFERQQRSGRLLTAAAFCALFVAEAAKARELPALSVGSGSLLADAILPYAMIWVGAALSALALGSAVVRQGLGPLGLIYAAGGFAVFALVTFLAPALGVWQSAEMTPALTYVFPLGVLGLMPLIVWVRRVMPTVTSIVAWIAFPVIMYACFWVVLGPVDRDRYPYSLRSVATESRSDGPN